MNTIVEAKNLCLGYKKNELIIKDASFTIYPKDFIFISGASGSGKSTLLRSIYGDLSPLAGELIVCDTDMQKSSGTKISKLRQRLGIVFQDYKLIEEWDVEKNIKLPMQINGYSDEVCVTQAEKLLQHINLLHKASKYPLELSGGEQQRVAMARALAHHPILILADEPTGNLDDYSSDMIWNLLKGVNTQLNITVVVVTHRIPSNFNMPFRRLNIDNGVINELS